jgi:hypothetical protein
MWKWSNSRVCALISIAMAACGDPEAERLDADDEVGGIDGAEAADESADGTAESGTADADGQSDTATMGDGDSATGDDTTSDGDGDGDASTMDGSTATGDGDTADGSSATGDGSTAGEGEMSTADGDGDSLDGGMTTGDGDGDSLDGGTSTGDGDGDMSTGDGDGDGDMTTGDGDVDTGSEAEKPAGVCNEVEPLILEMANRNRSFNDGDGNVEWCDRINGGGFDPEWDGPNWYRFMNGAGDRMPEFPPVPHSCGTEAPGWLNGDHPTVGEGVVPRTVCFAWGLDTCQWEADIEVVNCGDYYLYNLVNTQTCALRYCGTD